MELHSNKYISSCWTPLCFTLEMYDDEDDMMMIVVERESKQSITYAVCVFLGKKIFFSLSLYYYLKVYKKTRIL